MTTMTLTDLAVVLPRTPVALRFQANLEEVPGPTPDIGPCLLWTQAPDTGGYGRITDNGKRVGAHVWLWRTLNGPVPDGMEMHHYCHEVAIDLGLCEGGPCVHRRCVVHVRPATRRDNLLHGATFQAEQAARDWCTGKHGPHDLRDPANVWTPKDPARAHERHCRACNRERVREHRLKVQQLRARSARYGQQLTLIEP